MISNNRFSYIFRNPQDEFYNFFISSQNILKSDFHLQSSVTQSSQVAADVLYFSMDTDDEGRLHMIYLGRNGDLYHEIHGLAGTSRLLAHIDLNSNKLRFLTLKVLDSNIHIFYMLNKYNTKTWTISHCFFHEGKFMCHMAATVLSENHIHPFTVDRSKNELYLFYSDDSNYSYSIKRFDPTLQAWDVLDENIVIHNSHNTSFLVNHSNIAFICYTTVVNKNSYTMVKHRDLTKKYSSWSNAASLSEHSINAFHPYLAVDDDYTYVVWEEGNIIACKRTNSGGIDWSTKLMLSQKKSQIFNAFYISTHPEDYNFKANCVHVLQDKHPLPLINVGKRPENMDSVEKTVAVAIDSTLTKYLSEGSGSNEYVIQLQTCLQERDRKISELINHLNDLEGELENLNQLLEFKNDELARLKQDLDICKQASTSQQRQLQEEIQSHGMEVSASDMDSLKRLEEELTEKKDIIERLNILVNALYQDNNSKEYQIQQLEERLNRGLFHRIFK